MNPLDIAVHDFGGTGALALYAHATGFHSHVWVPVIDRLPHLHIATAAAAAATEHHS